MQCRATLRICLGWIAGFFAAAVPPLAIVWITVMIVSWEWPAARTSFALRRYEKRVVLSRDGFPDHISIEQVPTHIDFACFFEQPSNRSFDWICGNVDGTAAYLNPIGDRQIVALSLFPVLAMALSAVPGVILSLKSRCGAAILGVAVLALGGFIGVTLIVTKNLLTDFNDTAAGVTSIYPPATFGWTTSPGLLTGFAYAIMSVAAGSALAAFASVCTPVAADSEASQAPEDDTHGATAHVATLADDAAVAEGHPVPPGASPVEAYAVDGAVVVYVADDSPPENGVGSPTSAVA